MLALIASLGRSPGVITGTLDALIEEKTKPRKVIIATTSDPEILGKVIPLLEEEFRKNYPEIELDYSRIIIEKDDIYNEEDNAEFMIKVAKTMNDLNAAGMEIYLSLAGGRKTMSAAMAVLAQIYGVSELLHLLIDPDLEKKGSISELLRLNPKEREEVLHPPKDKRRLIRFPVFAIPWKEDDIIIALEKGKHEDPKLNSLIEKWTQRTRNMLLNILKDVKRLRK